MEKADILTRVSAALQGGGVTEADLDVYLREALEEMASVAYSQVLDAQLVLLAKVCGEEGAAERAATLLREVSERRVRLLITTFDTEPQGDAAPESEAVQPVLECVEEGRLQKVTKDKAGY